MLNSSAAARAQGIHWTRPYLVALCDEIRQALEAWAGEPDAGAPDLDQARAASRKLAATLEALAVPGAASLAAALGRALEAIEAAFTVLYTLEMLLKLMAFGYTR